MIESNGKRTVSLLGLSLVLVGCGLFCRAPQVAAQVTTTTNPVVIMATTTPVVPVVTPSLPASLAPFYLGVEYSQPLAMDVSSSEASDRWSVAAGSLPSGVVLDPIRGWLHGRPDGTGRSLFMLRLNRGSLMVEERLYEVTVGLAGTSPEMVEATVSSSTLITLPVFIIVPEGEYVVTVPSVPLTSPNIIPNWNTPRVLLLQNLADLEIQTDTLVRVSDDASGVNAHPFADVYYIGTDGKRHAFPNEAVYRTWYEGQPRIVEIPAWKLANIPLGRNVTYKPGKKLMQVASETRPYVVAPQRTLRPLVSDQVAPLIYGDAWKTLVEHLPETSVADYRLSMEGAVATSNDFNPTSLQTGYLTPSHEIVD